LPTFFQNSKRIRYFKVFWIPAFAGVTLQEIFYEVIRINKRR
jgi:hypothetical protein